MKGRRAPGGSAWVPGKAARAADQAVRSGQTRHRLATQGRPAPTEAPARGRAQSRCSTASVFSKLEMLPPNVCMSAALPESCPEGPGWVAPEDQENERGRAGRAPPCHHSSTALRMVQTGNQRRRGPCPGQTATSRASSASGRGLRSPRVCSPAPGPHPAEGRPRLTRSFPGMLTCEGRSHSGRREAAAGNTGPNKANCFSDP